MEIKRAIFAGTFDPFTKGHLMIIKKALKSFKEITVLIAINEKKKPTYSLNSRIKFIKLSTSGLKGIKVDYTDSLVVEYAKKHHINYLIRGVRNNKDKIYETKMSKVNKRLAPKIKTVLIKANESYQDISSSNVRSLKKKGGDLSPYVSSNIVKYL